MGQRVPSTAYGSAGLLAGGLQSLKVELSLIGLGLQKMSSLIQRDSDVYDRLSLRLCCLY